MNEEWMEFLAIVGVYLCGVVTGMLFMCMK